MRSQFLSNFDLWERFKTTKLGLAGDLWVLNPVRQAGKTTHGTFLASSSRGSGQLKTPITGMDKIGPGQSNSMSDSYGIRLGRFRLRGAPFSVQKDLLMRSFLQLVDKIRSFSVNFSTKTSISVVSKGPSEIEFPVGVLLGRRRQVFRSSGGALQVVFAGDFWAFSEDRSPEFRHPTRHPDPWRAISDLAHRFWSICPILI